MTTNDTALAIWTPEEVTTIRSVIAPGLTEPEFLFFAQVCRATGLNPLMNQIHAIKRYDGATGGQKLTIQTSIHGLRLIADRTKCYAPGRSATFETDIDGHLIAATAFVKKHAGGEWHEVSDTAYWDEYVQTRKDGKPAALWASKPHVMLAKCAESLALRRAFPAEMAGLYTDDEMPAHEPAPPPVVTQAVASTVAVIGGADPRTGDAPRPVTAETISGKREPSPVIPQAVAELKAAMKVNNWTWSGLVETVQPIWPGLDFTNPQAIGVLRLAEMKDLVEDKKHLGANASGAPTLIPGPKPPADDAASLDDLEFDAAPGELAI
jgi:phage recombination protein Bet